MQIRVVPSGCLWLPGSLPGSAKPQAQMHCQPEGGWLSYLRKHVCVGASAHTIQETACLFSTSSTQLMSVCVQWLLSKQCALAWCTKHCLRRLRSLLCNFYRMILGQALCPPPCAQSCNVSPVMWSYSLCRDAKFAGRNFTSELWCWCRCIRCRVSSPGTTLRQSWHTLCQHMHIHTAWHAACHVKWTLQPLTYGVTMTVRGRLYCSQVSRSRKTSFTAIFETCQWGSCMQLVNGRCSQANLHACDV
jgi:hypothetical protein